MFTVTKPNNRYEETKLISTLKNTLPKSFEVYMVQDVKGDYKIYLEDREEVQYGKYSSGLVYVHTIETLNAQFEGELCEPIETPDWVDGRKGFSTILYKGSYCHRPIKDSKEGMHVFDYTIPNPTHSLFKVNWGGANSPSRGFITPPEFEDNLIYLKRAESNGGGRGLTYAIISDEMLLHLEDTQIETEV